MLKNNIGIIGKSVLIILTVLLLPGCLGGGSSDSSITNTLPVANAGRDMITLNNAHVILDGRESSDVDGNPLTFSWSFVTKPLGSNSTLSNSTSSMPTFITDTPGSYTISLEVNDGIGSSFPDTVVITAFASISHIRDTGQNECYSNMNTTEITCPNSGEAFYGQDAHYSTNPLLFVDNGTTVSDNLIGLTWQKVDDGKKYNWYQAMGVYDATYNPGSIDVCGSLSLGGFTDWRLASRRELVSVLNYANDTAVSVTAGLADTTYFYSTGSDYWSSTTTQVSSSVAWSVLQGRVTYGFGAGAKSDALYVRCVRGSSWGQNDFVDNGDGTIKDNTSDLIWQMQDDGTAKNWEDALSYCENLTLAGSSNWRLADIKELESLVNINSSDETFGFPAINTTYFPVIKDDDYWSSTTHVNASSYAWTVNFSRGDVGEFVDKASFKFARCVR